MSDRRRERHSRFTRMTSVVSQKTRGSVGRVHLCLFSDVQGHALCADPNVAGHACHSLLCRCVAALFLGGGNHCRQTIFCPLFFFSFSFLFSSIVWLLYHTTPFAWQLYTQAPGCNPCVRSYECRDLASI
ncbi:hypothetical protein LZ32DRAFT_310825 [Colletotrichum eremochloae]|nr:hypothetical protein LZ32DRAFT_310825 [Colletotrichum eremochloae]